MQVPAEKPVRFWHSITFKLMIIGVLTLLMLIPGALIQGLIREREEAQLNVITEIGSKWGSGQTITGPVLTIPYYQVIKTDEKTYREIRYAHFLPEELNLKVRMDPEIRYRGIYKTVVYGAMIRAEGSFSTPDPGKLKLDAGSMIMEDAFLQIGISDMRGIQDNLSIKWNNSLITVEPGIPSRDVAASGFHAIVPLDGAEGFNCSFDLLLNGSEYLYFIPVGKENNVEIESSWGNPKFDGAFLPDERNVSDNGFTANWKVLHLNRNYPQSWKGSEFSTEESAFGTYLLLPVDQYRKTERSAKYAIMFIALTFTIFFFVEVLNRNRIHPVQYLLVGLSISIFYVLLLSLSEQIGFNLSYLISAAATIALITVYAAGIFKNFKLSLILSLCLLVLYIFLFTLIQLQDYALLLGSIGLFITMGLIMYASRNVDWYSTVSGKNNDRSIGF
jgi:inner membrane protein